MLKPEITVTLFPRKKTKTNDVPVAEPIVDYAKVAEEAAERLGKKLVIGAIFVTVTTVAAATLGRIAVTAVEHAINK